MNSTIPKQYRQHWFDQSNADPSGAYQIMRERMRQQAIEDYDDSHDDEHVNGELAMAAVCYATPVPVRAQIPVPCKIPCNCRSVEECTHGMFSKKAWRDPWPWDAEFDKRGKHDRIRQLVVAGALIAAEIDRLQRKLEIEKA